MQIGMGWLGWTEQQTLDTSIPAIELAWEGRVEMLKACFGGGDDPPPPSVPAEPPSFAAVSAVFRAAAGARR